MLRIVSAVVGAVMATGAVAAEPRALVMDIIGDTNPMIDAFDELDAGARIALVGDAEITLTFYPTCEDVTVRGGTVTITDTQMTVDQGEIVSSEGAECPSDVKLAPSDVINAAIITRAARPMPKIALRPVVSVIGADADGYTRMVVHTVDGRVGEVSMDDGKAVWPESVAALSAGSEYLVVLMGNGVQMRVAKVMAEADAPRVTVLRQ